MRIAHLADVHLGYRAYNRVTRQGLNVREADIFNAFRQSLAKIVEIQPDLIVIAGDLFHVVRPSNLCIEQTFKEFIKLRTETKAPVVLIGGNHDSPRSTDTGCILDLLKNVPGVHVVHQEYCGVAIPEIDTTVFCLCHRALPGLANLKLEPNAQTRYNVLTLHGTLEGVGRNFYDGLPPITRSTILQDGWDYVALGHYHLHEQLADNASYSGSLEYASTSIWQETDRSKGFVEYDLDDHVFLDFHKIKTRAVLDLRTVDAEGLSSAELNQLINMRIEGIKGGHQDKIIRLVVENVQRAIVPDIDYKTIRRIRSEALHFDLQLRARKKESIARDSDGNRALSLEEEWRDFVQTYDIPAEVDRQELVTTGLDYLGGETRNI